MEIENHKTTETFWKSLINTDYNTKIKTPKEKAVPPVPPTPPKPRISY